MSIYFSILGLFIFRGNLPHSPRPLLRPHIPRRGSAAGAVETSKRHHRKNQESKTALKKKINEKKASCTAAHPPAGAGVPGLSDPGKAHRPRVYVHKSTLLYTPVYIEKTSINNPKTLDNRGIPLYNSIIEKYLYKEAPAPSEPRHQGRNHQNTQRTGGAAIIPAPPTKRKGL